MDSGFDLNIYLDLNSTQKGKFSSGILDHVPLYSLNTPLNLLPLLLPILLFLLLSLLLPPLLSLLPFLFLALLQPPLLSSYYPLVSYYPLYYSLKLSLLLPL